MVDDTADTIPCNANTEALADELERFSLRHLDKHNRGSDFYSGWVTGCRDAAEFVRSYGAGE